MKLTKGDKRTDAEAAILNFGLLYDLVEAARELYEAWTADRLWEQKGVLLDDHFVKEEAEDDLDEDEHSVV